MAENDKGYGVLIAGGVGVGLLYYLSQRGQAGEQTTITISSEPYADVFVNDNYAGKTNSSGVFKYKTDMESGEIDVTIQKEGFEDENQTIDYTGSQEVDIELEPVTYTLELTVTT